MPSPRFRSSPLALCALGAALLAAPTRSARAEPKPGPASPSAAATPAPAAAPAAAPTPAAAPAYDAKNPLTWRLDAKLGRGSPLREELVRDLTRPAAGRAEAALTREEAEALLDDPRAQLVYGARTVSIVAPSMIQKQRKDHVDLLKLFLKPERIAAGAEFVRARRELLEAAEKKHGVAKEVVVSILMWESRLGSITGDYVAFNAFVSQAFFVDEANAVALEGEAERKLLDPAKQAERVEKIRSRARKNLLALVRTCKAQGMDPLTPKGSWAGALGFPQFMPASLQWAEDGNGDGKIDLFTFEDSIFSVSRYLREHGFKASREKAVWAYNHEDAYVQGVLAFADALRDSLAGKAPRIAAEPPAAAGEAKPGAPTKAAGEPTADAAPKPAARPAASTPATGAPSP